jgi:DNA-binding CsgD family transcriptional regulator
MQSNAGKNLAINLIRQGDLDSAYASIRQALDLAETQGALKELTDCYGVLSDYYAAAGDPAQARTLLLRQRDLRDSQFNLEKTRQIAELKAQYETEQQVAGLRRKAEAERESRIRMSLLAGIVCIALALTGYALYLRQQRARAQLLRSEAERLRLETEEEAQRLRAEHLEAELAYRNRELAAKTLHLVRKNEVLSEVSAQLTQLSSQPDPGGVRAVQQAIRSHISSDQDWEDFKLHFEAVHSGFFERLKARQPRLTPYDLRFCAYLRINLSTKEIAILLHASVRGMETQRYRLRKKLGLQRHEDLTEWIMQA